MNFCRIRNRIILSLLSIVCCIFLTACAGQVDGENMANGLLLENYDISVPEDITMEFFDINLLQSNRSMWEKHIYSIYDGQDDGMASRIPIGDYTVMHSHFNFESKENFSAIISYNEESNASQILFDENGKLIKIDISCDMGEEFSTSFLNIGDNAKDYFESSEKGLWDKFLGNETIVASSGWNIRHSTAVGVECTYDDLQVFNKDIYISYLIKDEVVEYIMVNVIGDITLSEDTGTEPSIYDLDGFEFYIREKSIAKMSGRDWVDLLGNSFEDMWRKFYEFSEVAAGQPGNSVTEYTVVDGEKLSVYYGAQQNTNIMSISTDFDSNSRFNIYYTLSKEGYFNMNVTIQGETSFITGNHIMPGDNIKTFLNSYEDGLYENIISHSYDTGDYCIGPYCFRFVEEGQGGILYISKNDDLNTGNIGIGFENEIVTTISWSCNGTMSDFESEPSIY